MKVKPYRVCDICKQEYQKRHGCLKIKRFYVPGWDWYGETHRFTNMDICPECGEILIDWIKKRRTLKEAIDGPGSICTDR